MRRESYVEIDITSLIKPFECISPDLSLHRVAELFSNANYSNVLSLPIVENGIPVGVISRYSFIDVYLKNYSRELNGRRPIRFFMNPLPILVAHDQPLAEAAQHVTKHMKFPLTEDFIITENGRYAGIGFVVDLLKAMELQMRENAGELNQAYTRLKSSQLALAHSEKMASLGQMVAGIAHEINTPLGYVQNNVSVGKEMFTQVEVMLASYDALIDSLLDDQVGEEQISAQMQQVTELRSNSGTREMMGEMQGLLGDTLYGVAQISELVLNLKDFSRMDAVSTETVNLHDCIESALNIGRNVLKDRIEIIRDFGELPTITCSPSQLNQVFLNLFTNAAQATEGNGKLTIRTWYENGSVHISIADNGKGISPEHVSRIFDPFFTTKPVGEGTGLGLAISHQIIQKHGGDIRVESHPGTGTCFYIHLPAIATTAQVAEMLPLAPDFVQSEETL
ncbi:MAG: ATPase [Gallionellales bacterium 35-53-114]|jgi:signal transduction histidine kinase|nr:MAG: ATPase [Gallionellales bacterium 35-53-114]OYZ62790.1 MAG: ATPase [Gallionellales bacterium 24-53-125]OZB09866.1 MAG: ATPase [Gallionellales bacterium 39-52-133]HQS57567.1 ATP-binding protein [Gallionellaceae bacterium]HQS74021.1 ATP-binding protein [Gallionellaceae bacterium]